MGSIGRRGRAVTIVVLLVLMMLPLGTTQAEDIQTVEQRITTLSLSLGEAQHLSFEAQQGTSHLIAWDCLECTVYAEGDDHAWTNGTGQTASVEVQNSTSVVVTTESQIAETISIMVVNNLMSSGVTTRPAPGSNTPMTVIGLCVTADDCLDTNAGTLASRISPDEDENYLLSGHGESSVDEYRTFEVSTGDTVEWQWLGSTSDISVQIYQQTDDAEHLFDQTHGLSEGFSELDGSSPRSAYWTATTNGRFVARISTNSAETAWAAHVMHHAAQGQSSLIETDLAFGTTLLGHGGTTALFEWNDVESLHVHAAFEGVQLRLDQFMAGAWVQGTVRALEAGDSWTVYPYPDTTVGRLTIENTSVYALDIITFSFADRMGIEAPSYLPDSLESNNSSWPLLNLTSVSSGEFTLAVHDTIDTYRLEVDGWVDSIHYLQFTLDGDVEGLEVQLWDFDQTTWEVLATDITQPVGDELKIGLQVGRGTHYLQLRFQNASSATPHLWGEEVPAKPYTIQGSYSLVDEGEEPWYPPSDEAVYWGEVARWFMGLLFLIPVIYLGISLRRSKAFAAKVAEKKQRLEWYTARLNSGESSIKEARGDLTKALHAVAQLAWQEGLEAWGPHRVQHRTENIALAVWQVDQRLAQSDDAWPLVVGVHVVEGSWELAALRFDAPEGSAFEVTNVEPRFLSQGEEVFLDAMHEGHRTYLLVELTGEASQVDVELNGRVNNEPFAARIPETVRRQS